MTWRGTLQPTALSRIYEIEISYRFGWTPKVKVISPHPSRPGELLPHVYREGNLCLHLPDEWSANWLIADTVVPWASEWLFFYEIWLATGDWHGGGVEPSGG